MVMEVVQEDYGDGNMQCKNHPYKTNSPAGGICVLCLQEKLGKLATSPFPLSTTTVFPSPSSSSSPSPPFKTTHHSKKSRFQFFSSKNKKISDPPSSSASHYSNNIIFRRSKSSVMPRRGGDIYTDMSRTDDLSTPRKLKFWSFTHFSQRHKNKQLVCMKEHDFVPAQEDGSPLNRKVSRSRSVGCGSRSFSGDIFERISTGFGECTNLRRVESQREGKFSGLFSSQRSVSNRPVAQLGLGRGKSWVWALASPIRALKPSSSSASNKNGAPQ